MPYEVEVSDEFRIWYEPLSEAEQNSIERVVLMLAEAGPALGFPYSSGIQGSTFSHMRELRIQHEGRPYRVLYAFDPSRSAFLILGGDKTGDNRWYDKMIPNADAIYQEHLTALQEEQKRARNKKRPGKSGLQRNGVHRNAHQVERSEAQGFPRSQSSTEARGSRRAASHRLR